MSINFWLYFVQSLWILSYFDEYINYIKMYIFVDRSIYWCENGNNVKDFNLQIIKLQYFIQS